MIISDSGWITEELENGNVRFYRDIFYNL